MIRYGLHRILESIPTLLILAALTFFLMRLAPGGPFDSDQAWPPEIKANIERKYELDQPLLTQFGHWMRDVAHGDLRESFQYLGRPVTEIIRESLPPSLLLGGWAFMVSIILGIPFGVLAARRPNAWVDRLTMGVSVIGVSLPSYLIASLLVLVFSLYLGWLPAALWEGPQSWILPVITLACRPIAIVARLTRSAMIETLQSDYVRTVKAKGAHPLPILFKHALKNAMIPVFSALGPIAANLVTGSFLVEMVFQVPGMGKHFVQAVLNRDYPLVMGITLIYGVILMTANLAMDLLTGWADPRIRMGET